MAYSLYLSAGHAPKKYNTDPGAFGNGYWEGDLTDELVDLISAELNVLQVSHFVDPEKNVLANTLAELKKKDTTNFILVEFHFNAATPKATGVETIIPAGYTSVESTIAGKISEIIGTVLSIPLRGSKGVITEAQSARGRLGFMRPPGLNILSEVCFISNPTEIQKYQSKKNQLAKELAKYLSTLVKG